MLIPLALVATFLAVVLTGLAVELSAASRRRTTAILRAQVQNVEWNMREEELSRPLAARTILPVLSGLRQFGLRLTPLAMRERIARNLVLAGSPPRWDAERIAALKVVGALGLGAGGVMLSRILDLNGLRSVGVVALLVVIGFFASDGILARAVQRRQEAIRKEMPDTMDLLTIIVQAGLGFDSALLHVVGHADGPLALEIARTLQEMQLGVARTDALRHLSDRTDVEELNSFVLALIQAEKFGVSIAKILRAQAKELRTKRRQRAEQKAMQVPVKLIFPLIVCLLPALLVVIAGPAAIQIARSVFGN
jgi:tight adherence protein C